MSSSITEASRPTETKAKPAKLYAIAWRWHFYSGLYVIPFLLMLATTGLVMVFFTGFQSRLGFTVHVTPQAQVAAVTAQANAVLQQFPHSSLKEFIAPKAPDVASWFVIGIDGSTQAVAVNPYTNEILKTVDKDWTIFMWAEKIHGKLLIGDLGSRFIEVAAGLGIVMIITGLYLYWPRQGTRWSEVLIPDVRASGRKLWKSLHSSVGFWVSVILFLFLLSGMAWTGVWGGKLVQPWGTFPAQKWDDVPKSDLTHASLNTAGEREVPWGLEQTPLPLSGSNAGNIGVPAGEAVNLDGIYRLATKLGFTDQFHINVPQDDKGVYTVSADTMSGDLKIPTHDRTVHIDRYTGKILADVGFVDYSIVAKAMAVGIALHQGDLGLWNALLNVAFCTLIIFLTVSGVVMWWMRRPAGALRLGAPGVPVNAAIWKTGAILMAAVALAFPLTGAFLVCILMLDFVLISRVSALKSALN